jgi:hypothetical protein
LEAAFQVHDGDARASILEDAAVALFARPELRLSLFNSIDVCVAAEPFDDVACVVSKRYAQGAEPSIGSVVAAEAELTLKIFAFSPDISQGIGASAG